MIAVAQDEEGLRQAAREVLEESFTAPARERNQRIAEQSEDPELVLRAGHEERSLSPGYYLWLDYLAEAIEQPLEAGVSFGPADLLADELLGLSVLKEARAEFRRKHPPCRGCNRPLPNEWDKLCNDCQREIAAADAARARGAR
jgi:fructose-specific component phosphotransferase system IIB-like protein